MIAIALLSILVSMILGSIVWLVIGERFPLGDDFKLPPLNNIAIYTLLLVVPVFLLIFFVFSW